MKGQDVSTVERLRPLVGRGGWDYCVVWEVSQDQRFLELKSCCCGGTEHTASLHPGALILGGLLQPQLGFPPMARACRDGRSPQHPRTAACDALADLPARIPLDCSSSTTVHAQALVTGVPAWMYPSELRADCTGSNEATRATKVLVPVPGGLAELFVQNHVPFSPPAPIKVKDISDVHNPAENLQVPEDQDVVNFVMSRFTNPDESSAFAAAADFQPFRGGLNCGMNTPTEISRSWVVAPTSIPSCDHPGFPWDLHAGQSRLCASSLNLFEGTSRDDDGFFEGSADSIHCERLPAHPVDSTVGVGVHGPITPQMSDIITTAAMAEYSTVTRELGGGHEKESVKEEGEGRADSGMEGSDPGDDDEGGRSGRRLSSKNLLAERRRRKKLNDRLYTLRSLVPKISKMDRASILGDAIEFVKELQNQVKKLQEQLEETSPEDSGTKQAGHVDDKHVHPNNVDGRGNNNDTLQSPGGRRPEKLHQTGSISPEMENSSSPKRNGGYLTANASKQHRSSPATNEEKGNQMEPQVEVCQIGANKFHLKVFCEHKRGGFVRLMEAMASLGLDVTTVNVTTSTPLVLNIFEVEVIPCPHTHVQKRDGEVVQAEQLRSSLLRLGMDSEDAGWPGDSNMAVEKVGRGITTPVAAGRRTCLNTSMQVDSHQHAHHQHCLHQQLP